MTCTCWPIVRHAGGPIIGHDWRSTCLVHGYTSEWFSNGGKAYFVARTEWDHEVDQVLKAKTDPTNLIGQLPQLDDFGVDNRVSSVHQPTEGSADELGDPVGSASP